MRNVLIAGLTAALAAPWAAEAQPAPPPLEAADVAPLRTGPDPGPQPGDVAPAPPPVAEPKKKKKKFNVAETAGGAVGGALAKTAATAFGGPVAGIAAGMVGARVGRATVGLVKNVVGGDKKDDAQDVSANVPEPVGLSEFTPAPEPAPELRPVEITPPDPDGPGEPIPVAVLEPAPPAGGTEPLRLDLAAPNP